MSPEEKTNETVGEEYGATFITLVDEDDGTEIELELMDTLEHEGETYAAFYMDDEENPDEAGVVILRLGEEDGMEVYESVEDEALMQVVYDKFMEILDQEESDE